MKLGPRDAPAYFARPDATKTGLLIYGSDAMRVATEGWGALFDGETRSALQLDNLPAELWRQQEEAIAEGHCNQLPADTVPALARAQIARDIAEARKRF